MILTTKTSRTFMHAVIHISSKSVETQLSPIPDAKDTNDYLELIHYETDTFLDKNRDVLCRLETIGTLCSSYAIGVVGYISMVTTHQRTRSLPSMLTCVLRSMHTLWSRLP